MESRGEGSPTGQKRCTTHMVHLIFEDSQFRSFSRDVIVEIRLVAHMRPQYIDDDELLFFEREDMRRRTSVSEQAERKADGHDDSHVWG